MIYLKDIENSTRALTRVGYRNKSYTRLNKLKSLNIDYVMTSDVFLKYAWLVGMNQYRRFYTKLDFNLSETSELYIYLSFSINNSFEWIDPNANGEWDLDASIPANNEAVVDMGLRGLIPSWEWKE